MQLSGEEKKARSKTDVIKEKNGVCFLLQCGAQAWGGAFADSSEPSEAAGQYSKFFKFEYEYDDDGIAIPIITKEIFIESFKEALEILKKEAWERGG